jgi:anhydro-N-acetylmuramic acid kinase
MKPARLIIGLMSGTSVDAIDAALVRIEGRGGGYRAKVLGHIEHKWPTDIRERLLAVMAPADTTTQEVCQLNFLVTRQFAQAIRKLLTAGRVSAMRITAIASHGQTICHLPPQMAAARKRKSKTENQKIITPSTLQIGDVSVLAALTGIPCVGNFRTADMAFGGQGAPLVPFADALLLSHRKLARCVQNIGGIANVTYLPAVRGQWSAAGGRGVIAFDTGPGNMLLDAVVRLVTKGRQAFDQGGRIAASGKLCERLLRVLQRHSYFARTPPKSTGRELFGEAYARRLVESYENRNVSRPDLIHTLTRLTAWAIGGAYRRYLPRMPEEVILCGGGADNPVLVDMLAEELGGVPLRRIDEFGIPNKAKEAASFALLAAATLDGIAGNLPSVTGAVQPAVLGEIADQRFHSLR